jgi:hypothetical protein
MPSVNFAPWISFGNWLWPSSRRQFFCAGSTSLTTMASAVLEGISMTQHSHQTAPTQFEDAAGVRFVNGARNFGTGLVWPRVAGFDFVSGRI